MSPEAATADGRWQLYRLLGEPLRVQLLALAGQEELSVGELAVVMGIAQPSVSRHARLLRDAGLLADRKDGTRTFIRLAPAMAADPLVVDAVAEGRRLSVEDGSLDRVADVLSARDARTREFFRRASAQRGGVEVATELPAYLYALGRLLPRRGLAIDAGTGAGPVLDVLAPLFERVLGVDRSEAQLDRARERVRQRGYRNVELACLEVDELVGDPRVSAGADLVVASRMLHHASVPRATLLALGRLLAPGAHLVVVDYARHEDEALREAQADVWAGFTAGELLDLAQQAGLCDALVVPIPPGCTGVGPDRTLAWHALVARAAGTGSGPRGPRLAAPKSDGRERCAGVA